MDREKAIGLIQKVLAKANNNPSEKEAESAMLKAQELLIKYNLSMSDVEDIDIPEKLVSDSEVTDKTRTSWWIRRLSAVIAYNFRCESILSRRGGKSCIKFVGIKDDVDIAIKVFNYAKDILVMLADNYVTDLVNEYNKNWWLNDKLKTKKDYVGEKNDYIQGFIDGLEKKYKEQVNKNNWGLILVKDKMVTEYMKDAYKHLHKGQQYDVAGSGDASHYQQGYKQGKSFDYAENRLRV